MKKHFLVIWPTKRKDWVSIFSTLSDKFQLTFIPGTFSQNANYAEGFVCRYWSEFESVEQILSELKPDGLIFMSIESGLSMVLNYSAQNKGLKTYILQHGVFTNYKDYRIREKLWRKRSRAIATKKEQNSKGFSSFRFIWKSLKGLNKMRLLPIAIYTQLQQRVGPYWVSKFMPLSMKKADIYLCLSPFNATIHKETDRIKDQKIRYIGSAELEKYMIEEKELISDQFYIHIDQALAENSFGEETMPRETMIDFYGKLNFYCKSQGCRLYVKLHPESYDSDWLPNDDNIRYLRDVENLNQFIQSARGCFGFFSTMVIPALYWKPTVLFNILYSGLQEEIGHMKAANVLDFWSFQPEDIVFGSKADSEQIRKRFIRPDGIKSDELISILTDD